MEAHTGGRGSHARQVRGFRDFARHQSSRPVPGTHAREPGGTAGEAEGFWMIFPRRGAEDAEETQRNPFSLVFSPRFFSVSRLSAGERQRPLTYMRQVQGRPFRWPLSLDRKKKYP